MEDQQMEDLEKVLYDIEVGDEALEDDNPNVEDANWRSFLLSLDGDGVADGGYDTGDVSNDDEYEPDADDSTFEDSDVEHGTPKVSRREMDELKKEAAWAEQQESLHATLSQGSQWRGPPTLSRRLQPIRKKNSEQQRKAAKAAAPPEMVHVPGEEHVSLSQYYKLCSQLLQHTQLLTQVNLLAREREQQHWEQQRIQATLTLGGQWQEPVLPEIQSTQQLLEELAVQSSHSRGAAAGLSGAAARQEYPPQQVKKQWQHVLRHHCEVYRRKHRQPKQDYKQPQQAAEGGDSSISGSGSNGPSAMGSPSAASLPAALPDPFVCVALSPDRRSRGSHRRAAGGGLGGVGTSGGISHGAFSPGSPLLAGARTPLTPRTPGTPGGMAIGLGDKASANINSLNSPTMGWLDLEKRESLMRQKRQRLSGSAEREQRSSRRRGGGGGSNSAFPPSPAGAGVFGSPTTRSLIDMLPGTDGDLDSSTAGMASLSGVGDESHSQPGLSLGIGENSNSQQALALVPFTASAGEGGGGGAHAAGAIVGPDGLVVEGRRVTRRHTKACSIHCTLLEVLRETLGSRLPLMGAVDEKVAKRRKEVMDAMGPRAISGQQQQPPQQQGGQPQEKRKVRRTPKLMKVADKGRGADKEEEEEVEEDPNSAAQLPAGLTRLPRHLLLPLLATHFPHLLSHLLPEGLNEGKVDADDSGDSDKQVGEHEEADLDGSADDGAGSGDDGGGGSSNAKGEQKRAAKVKPERTRVVWTDGEDKLLVRGLHRFPVYEAAAPAVAIITQSTAATAASADVLSFTEQLNSNNSNGARGEARTGAKMKQEKVKHDFDLIHQYLLPTKQPSQIRNRLKNLGTRKAKPNVIQQFKQEVAAREKQQWTPEQDMLLRGTLAHSPSPPCALIPHPLISYLPHAPFLRRRGEVQRQPLEVEGHPR
jgi:hypothetical protein